MKYNIVFDSTVDIFKNFNKYIKGNDDINFDTIPLKLIVGDKEYIDSDDIDIDKLLSSMKAEKEASHSACPSPEAFATSFRKAQQNFCFTMSSELSGTYQSAMIAKHIVEEENPLANICVIDTKATSGVLLLMAKKTIELIKEENNFENILLELNKHVKSLRLTFSLADFDTFIKTGRVKPFVGALASKLGIRAIAIKTEKGTIEVTEKARGEIKNIQKILKIMLKTKDLNGATVVINHCKNLPAALKIKEKLIENGAKEVVVCACKGLSSFYAQEKGIIISY